ncbi:MAG: TatD family hydrolase [Mycoplasmataceae bacterium]|jgi:TatD DNase family protein|nr:TatD family hydrolase [Mycoplasmataceae bacterium]
MKYFDIHTHVNLSPLVGCAKEAILDCQEQDIFLTCVGTNVNNSNIAVELSNQYPNVYATIGIHPSEVQNVDIKIAMEEFDVYLNEHDTHRVVAVGETGLDYHYEPTDRSLQKQAFIAHIDLAKKHNLTLMVHVRDAHDDCLEILRKCASGLRIIIHCFTSNKEIAKQYVDLGCWVSFPGVITFNKNIDELKESLKSIPLDKILSETDAPYLAPEPKRGQTNAPIYITYIVEAMAKILGLDLANLQQQLVNNALAAFAIAPNTK